MFRTSLKADYVGAIASLLCLVHCAATPFLFLVKTCARSCCVDVPTWWQLIDYGFLGISGLAIYYATKRSTKYWMQIALWSAWGALLFTIVNEGWGVVSLPEGVSYLPALVIVGLHLYNQRYCKYTGTGCCAPQSLPTRK